MICASGTGVCTDSALNTHKVLFMHTQHFIASFWIYLHQESACTHTILLLVLQYLILCRRWHRCTNKIVYSASSQVWAQGAHCCFIVWIVEVYTKCVKLVLNPPSSPLGNDSSRSRGGSSPGSGTGTQSALSSWPCWWRWSWQCPPDRRMCS